MTSLDEQLRKVIGEVLVSVRRYHRMTEDQAKEYFIARMKEVVEADSKKRTDRLVTLGRA